MRARPRPRSNASVRRTSVPLRRTSTKMTVDLSNEALAPVPCARPLASTGSVEQMCSTSGVMVAVP